MELIIVSILIGFLLGLAVGYFIGIKRAFGDIKHKILPIFEKKIEKWPKPPSQLKVLRKSEPKTFEQKRSEALEKDKPIIKTFYK